MIATIATGDWLQQHQLIPGKAIRTSPGELVDSPSLDIFASRLYEEDDSVMASGVEEMS